MFAKDALGLALQILDRDGIRPLYGQAFNQTELEDLQETYRTMPDPCPVCDRGMEEEECTC